MQKIFEEYGGVIVTVIAVVALISLVILLMEGEDSVMFDAFDSITKMFVNESQNLIDNAI